jgi:hypothetical protein
MSAATAWNSDASAAEVVEYGGLITDMHRQLIDTQVEYFSELENAIADNAMIVVASSFEWTNEIIIGNGMTVDISKADGTDPVFDGQGERFWNVQSGGTLTVSGLTFENGYDDSGYGGAAYITGIASFVNCAFNNNDAQYEAGCCGAGYGGVAYITGNTSFTNCTFNNNKAKGGSLQSGDGGVAYITGVASFANCVFNNNNEAYFGGVAYVTGTASFVNCVFNNNILLLSGRTRGLGSAVHVGTSYPAPWWDYGRCEFQEPVHSGEVTFVACEFYESYSGKEAQCEYRRAESDAQDAVVAYVAGQGKAMFECCKFDTASGSDGCVISRDDGSSVCYDELAGSYMYTCSKTNDDGCSDDTDTPWFVVTSLGGVLALVVAVVLIVAAGITVGNKKEKAAKARDAALAPA